MYIRLASLLVLAAVAAGSAFAQAPQKKVSASEALSAAVSKPQPVYPPVARHLKLEGSVEIEAVVTEDGAVEKVNIVTGNPVLTKSAVEALKKWKFKPFMVDGKPVRAVAPVSFAFKL
jgi:protein TonB